MKLLKKFCFNYITLLCVLAPMVSLITESAHSWELMYHPEGWTSRDIIFEDIPDLYYWWSLQVILTLSQWFVPQRAVLSWWLGSGMVQRKGPWTQTDLNSDDISTAHSQVTLTSLNLKFHIHKVGPTSRAVNRINGIKQRQCSSMRRVNVSQWYQLFQVSLSRPR